MCRASFFPNGRPPSAGSRLHQLLIRLALGGFNLEGVPDGQASGIAQSL
jgi:hypothetical protein